MATLIETTVGTHRGKPRIYLEGKCLEREGFISGEKYSRNITDDKMKLTLIEGGKYVVSKKTARGKLKPVIDIRSERLNDLSVGGRVRVLIANKTIIILRHFLDDRIAERIKRIISNMEKNDLRTGSLFHGGGVASKALHEGLEYEGVKSKIAMAVEIERPYIESSLTNNPELWDKRSLVINASVASVRFHKPGIPLLDILEAGIPCTGASQAGKSSLGLTHAEDHPTAGAAFFSLLQAIDKCEPTVVVLENVKNYMTTASASVIRSVLSSLGYSIQEKLVTGSKFGAFENRERWILLATTIGLEEIINLEHIDEFKEVAPASFSEIMDSEIDESIWKDYQYLRDKEVRDIAAKKGFRMQILNEESTSCGVIPRGYNKVQGTNPIIGRPDGKLRLFSKEEHAKAKTIPTGVVAGLSDTIAHQILGQSCVYNWFIALGRVIGKGLKESSRLQEIALAKTPQRFAQAA